MSLIVSHVPILSQTNPVYTISYNFFKIRFNIQPLSISRSSKFPVSFRLSPPKFCVLFPCSHKCHMPLLLNSPFGYYSCSVKDKAICAYAIRNYGGIGGIALLILNLDTRLR